jgi:hypothetical protein
MNLDAAAGMLGLGMVAVDVEATMTRKLRSKAAGGKHLSRPAPRHPHSVATIAPQGEPESFPDQPFVGGAKDELNPDLRHRLISEAAFHRYANRGYDEGYDRDDWLEAETQVDHVVIGPKPG